MQCCAAQKGSAWCLPRHRHREAATEARNLVAIRRTCRAVPCRARLSLLLEIRQRTGPTVISSLRIRGGDRPRRPSGGDEARPRPKREPQPHRAAPSARRVQPRVQRCPRRAVRQAPPPPPTAPRCPRPRKAADRLAGGGRRAPAHGQPDAAAGAAAADGSRAAADEPDWASREHGKRVGFRRVRDAFAARGIRLTPSINGSVRGAHRRRAAVALDAGRAFLAWASCSCRRRRSRTSTT